MVQVASLPGDDRLPRYQRLVEALKDAIARKAWQPGERLPSEMDLAERYGVAPGTVRQAISALVDAGLVERQQGRGTFLRKPTFNSSLFRFFRFQGGDGMRRVPESRILRRERTEAPATVSAELGCRAGDAVIFMSRLRLLDGDPVLAEEIWLPFDRFEAFLELDERDIGPLLYPIYETVCGEVVARAEERLTAESVRDDHAKLLGLAPGTPVIVIDRLARGYDDRPLEWRRSRGRADRFQYHVEIR